MFAAAIVMKRQEDAIGFDGFQKSMKVTDNCGALRFVEVAKRTVTHPEKADIGTINTKNTQGRASFLFAESGKGGGGECGVIGMRRAAIGHENDMNGTALKTLECDQSTTAKSLVVGMWCDHQNRPRRADPIID